MTRPTIVFDVNETLLDLRGLDAPFTSIFGSSDARVDWFKQLLQLSLLANTLEQYADFGVLSMRALAMVAAQRGHVLSDEERKTIAAAVRALVPHPDVTPALTHLRGAGFRLAALTNSTGETVQAQIVNAALRDHFDALLSVDAVHQYKPALATYRYAAEELAIAIGDMLLVAAHGWDVLGAMRAGARAAFVARPGQVLIPDAPIPEIVAPTLTEVAERLVAGGG
ncbi:MAG: haloacid dehalogenase type II [Candidatus Velthaea sp.]